MTAIILASCSQPEEKTTAKTDYEAINYKLFFGDNESGYMKSWLAEDGTYKYEWEFNDRGRGPHLVESINLDENGFISALEIIGHNYLKDTVFEHFENNGEKAEWKSTSEAGVATAKEGHYLGINSGFGNTELMLRNMLTSKAETIELYPSGNVKLSGTKKYTFGDTLELQLVEYNGLSFTPSYVWLDGNNRFFAYPSTWLTFIREGYEDLKQELLDHQTNSEKEYYKNLARTLTQIPDGKVVFKNANVFDAQQAKIITNKHVVVSEGKIESIIDGTAEVPEAAEVIDATNKTLLPGLFDMHGHLDRSQGLMNLAAGVTSVRDMANSFDLPDIKKEFDDNTVLGPRILIMSGFIDKAGPYAGPIGKIINNLEEGLEAIDFYHERGYQQIKLYSSIDPEWVKPLAERAHSLGMKLSGHIPSYMLAEEAIEAGYDEIQHVNMLALNFLSDTIDTRTPLRFSMIGEHTHTLDLESKEFKDFVNLMKVNNIVSDPTVSIFEGMLSSKAGEPDPSFASILDRLPIQVKRGFYSGGLPIPDGKVDQYKASYAKLLAIVKALYDAGIVIVPGTDSMVGFGLHTELENYVRAGIPAPEVLKIATYNSAEVIGVQEELGSIEVGKTADLILVNGDPIKNIGDIRKVDLTMKGGNMYSSKDLYEAIGITHYQ
ncbi:amidohydrolase [Fulvivirga lutimaris]|nr:amidohydrolase [Fulvivirga lutimaris]